MALPPPGARWSPRLSNDMLTYLVGLVVVDGQDVPTVARQSLTAEGLL